MSPPPQPEPIPAVSAAEARRLVSEAGAVVVDVREADELAQTGRLAGALHIPLGEVEAQAGRLPKERPILLYCRAGVRSAAAGAVLSRGGFTRVFNLGGFAEAVAAGFPVEP